VIELNRNERSDENICFGMSVLYMREMLLRGGNGLVDNIDY
jgi:hypothetical protein